MAQYLTFARRDSMICPTCKVGKTIVVDTYCAEHMVRRKRKCKKCSSIFWTKEVKVAKRMPCRKTYMYNKLSKEIDKNGENKRD